MLKIINDLKPFFEDCYQRINVREYAKLMRISPPTASKLLSYYNSEGLLKRESYRNYLFFFANKESPNFIDLSRMYWRHRLSSLTAFLEKELLEPTIVLFGSLAKAEAKRDSDVDLAIFSQRKRIDVSVFEKKLKRKIQIFWFRSFSDIRSRELTNNILNGYVLKGRLNI